MFRICTTALVIVVLLNSSACQNKQSTQAPSYTTAGRKTMSRQDFEKAVKGKSPNEVVAAIGEPDQKAPAAGKDVWMYAAITTAGSKPDVATHVYFENNKVVKVEFTDPNP